jgi:hypothetical protein
MPRKVFVAGEILTAADVNTNLMDQAVMSFAGTAARGSAIPTPVEGMVTYLNDADRLEVYTNAWKPVGGVLQVVTARKTAVQTINATFPQDITDLSVSITPTSANSLIIVQAAVSAGFGGVNNAEGLSLFRGSTNLANPTSPGSRTPTLHSQIVTGGTRDMVSVSLYVVDSPGVTTSLTYKAAGGRLDGTETLYINQGAGDTDAAGFTRGVSTITVMEIAG